jgi:hypothetical protein
MAVLAACSWNDEPGPAVKFAQLTDPHVFDAGKPRNDVDWGAARSEATQTVRDFINEVRKQIGSSPKVVNLIDKSYSLPNNVIVVGLDSSTFKNEGCL